MDMQLQRCEYHPRGTNGRLLVKGRFICHTIELPWQNNAPRISCIPEGNYTVVKRYSRKFKWHLHLTDVPGRKWILIHPANHAIQELKGCIAPVTEITAPGEGSLSRKAFRALMQEADSAIAGNETLSLTIIPPCAG